MTHAPRGNPRVAKGQRRLNMRKRVLAEEDHCALCGKPVDTTLPPHLPMSPEVDEIVSIAAGGSPFIRENLQLTHRSCNQRKGSGLAARTEPQHLPLPLSQQW